MSSRTIAGPRRTLIALWVVLQPLLGGAAAAQANPAPTNPARTVLALFFSSEDYPANPVHDQGIRDAFQARPDWPIDYYTEYLESDRFPAEQASLALRDYLRDKYQARKIDAVLAVTDTALRFALRFRDELFPQVPIVYFGNVPIDESVRREGAGITGVTVGGGFAGGLSLALSLHPTTEHLFVVAQTPNIALQQSIRTALVETARQARLTFITEASLPGLLSAVKAVPPNSVIFYVRHSQEQPGQVLFAADVARLVAGASPVPVYGVTDSYIGTGVVGGSVYRTRAIGVRLGQLVLEVFDGTPAQDLPIEGAAPAPIFDWRQLRRWGVSESRLPPGSTVLFRELGLWDQYKAGFIAAALLIGLQAALIATLLVQRKRRRIIETRLVESQQRYSLASAAGAVGVWDWNFETNELFIDTGLKAILGFDDSEISTRTDDWGSRVHPQDVPAALAAVQRCIDGASDAYEVEHRMIHKSGAEKWMLSRGSAIRGPGGRLQRLVGTKVDITDRKRAEDAIRESEAVLKATHREIHDLAGRLITSQEGERARIARDLHDDLSQQLAGVSIALSALKRRLLAIPESGDLPEDVASLQQKALGLADNIRRLSHDLHPSVLQHAGLVSALRGHCADIQRWHEVVVTFSANGEFDSTDAEVALCLYRVGQEALRNVATHACATRAEVRLTRIGGDVELLIADDGKGFDIIESGRQARGLGLVSITERVRLAGGTVSIVTELAKGTRLRVQIPANGQVLAAPVA